MNTPDSPKTTERRFRIAFSFAGEKREFVRETAEWLAERIGASRILYDKFHESEFARWNLGIYLPKLYLEQSDLIVPVLCPDYDTKRWTGWEWAHIYSLLTRSDGHRVMPARFGHAHVEGLTEAAGFIELDQKAPAQFAILVLERLALNEDLPTDHFIRATPVADTPLRTIVPNNLPPLPLFFGRERELRTIANAVGSDSHGWGVLIEGPPGMGKTSLAVKAGYEVLPDAFHRILFVSLKSRTLDDDRVRSLGELAKPSLAWLLNEIARGLQQPHVSKSPKRKRSRLLHDALRATRTLLILDNLESLEPADSSRLLEFVRSLPQGCKAILTTRERIGRVSRSWFSSGSNRATRWESSLNWRYATPASRSSPTTTGPCSVMRHMESHFCCDGPQDNWDAAIASHWLMPSIFCARVLPIPTRSISFSASSSSLCRLMN